MTNQEQGSKNILIVGCGKIGLRLGEILAQTHRVWGMRRSAFSHDTIHPLQADVRDSNSLREKLPEDIDYLIYCLTPPAMTEEAYRAVYVEGLNNVLRALKSEPKRLFFISSTSVYHQNDSTMVDEQSLTAPESFSGRTLLEAEQLLESCSYPTTVVRFSGIYGGSRSRLINLVRSGSAKLTNESRLTNRIHEDDCVGFLQHLILRDMDQKECHKLYLASDSLPCEYNEVIQFIAEQCRVTLETTDLPPKRRAGNKKCSNKRLVESGYELKHPTFKEGYAAMLKPNHS